MALSLSKTCIPALNGPSPVTSTKTYENQQGSQAQKLAFLAHSGAPGKSFSHLLAQPQAAGAPSLSTPELLPMPPIPEAVVPRQPEPAPLSSNLETHVAVTSAGGIPPVTRVLGDCHLEAEAPAQILSPQKSEGVGRAGGQGGEQGFVAGLCLPSHTLPLKEQGQGQHSKAPGAPACQLWTRARHLKPGNLPENTLSKCERPDPGQVLSITADRQPHPGQLLLAGSSFPRLPNPSTQVHKGNSRTRFSNAP